MNFRRNPVRLSLLMVLCLVLGWLLLAGNIQAATTQPEKERHPHGVKLFDTIAFRGSLKALPNWTRVLAKAQNQTVAMMACEAPSGGCSSASLSWRKIQKQVSGLPRFEQLKKVNAYFNRWPYRLDMDIYGTSDYWATPLEFLRNSGDCEDFSISKFYALKQLGFDADELRIVVLTDTIRNIGHAVLTVSLDGDAYVLDNISDPVFSHTQYEHYLPHYSVNEHYRWAHARPIRTKKMK